MIFSKWKKLREKKFLFKINEHYFQSKSKNSISSKETWALSKVVNKFWKICWKMWCQYSLCSVKDEWKLVNQLSIWLLYPSRKACGTRCLLSRIFTLNCLFYLHRNVDFELTDTFVKSNNRQSQLSTFPFEILFRIIWKKPRICQECSGQKSTIWLILRQEFLE